MTESQPEPQPEPQVEVRRSARRKRTISAYRSGDTIVVLIPATLSKRQEHDMVKAMVAKVLGRESRRKSVTSDEELLQRAGELNDLYFGGIAVPHSVRWVANQHQRWGSCTPRDKSIRLSRRLQDMPPWVVDYVLVHELAHLLESAHNASFWAWVARYPHTEKAKGFLLGWSAASNLESPPGEGDELD